MLSRLFKQASLISLLVCIAAISMWTWGRYGRNFFVIGRSPRYSLGFDQHALVFTRDRAVSEQEAEAELAYLHQILRPADPRYANIPDTPATSKRSDFVIGGRATWTRSYGPVYVAVGEQKLYHDVPNSHWFAFSHPFGPWMQVSVSYWFLIIASALLPLVAAWRSYRQYMRRIRGQCEVCGYSLVGNTNGICPECGSSIVRAPEADRMALSCPS